MEVLNVVVVAIGGYMIWSLQRGRSLLGEVVNRSFKADTHTELKTSHFSTISPKLKKKYHNERSYT